MIVVIDHNNSFCYYYSCAIVKIVILIIIIIILITIIDTSFFENSFYTDSHFFFFNIKKVKPEYVLIEGDPTQINELIPQGMDTSSFSPSSSSIPSSDPDPTKNHFMYVCKKK